ncbi:MAG TPA: UDP-N-acetylglucosamine--N-acetylmuramyl-(pentapeptide) pyrophosphoryl-undecaprenol N-acetylglucosamine transferase, partial [Dehalococcoidia bacterium]|nr:UDP-N-acetylglucosamine--N-acetylmuramyl-(pentapeptide) pyrophosphoryl-undecaprenol N-acetylglucosamine transferase [Dehalococcoidia bacterium]
GYGFWQARRFLRKNNPQAILSTGGYASFPVVLAAASLKVPQVVYLPDVYPGWAVRVSARLAQRAAVSSEKSLGRLPKGKTTVTGYPVRPQFWLARRAEGRRRLGLNPEEKVLFVSGASQGSRHLNETVATNLLGLLELCEVVHLSGRAHEAKLTELKEGLPTESRSRYHLYGYLHDELPWAMAAADLAVCRAGASVMGELPAVGLPAVLVPYPYAGGHQRLNARHLEEKGAAIILEDRNLQREFLPLIGSLLNDSERLTKMREASQALARPEAATRIARLLLEVARNNGR